MNVDDKGNVKKDEAQKEVTIEELLAQILNREREKKKEIVSYV
ncbi:MAG: hypothetical protein QXL14_02110 [Candidatus Aenigmatarchaeota archaeon]